MARLGLLGIAAVFAHAGAACIQSSADEAAFRQAVDACGTDSTCSDDCVVYAPDSSSGGFFMSSPLNITLNSSMTITTTGSQVTVTQPLQVSTRFAEVYFLGSSASLTIESLDIVEFGSTGDGGAIWASGTGSLVLNGVYLLENAAEGSGGALYFDGNGTGSSLTIRNSTLSTNSAGVYGGGVATAAQHLTDACHHRRDTSSLS